MKKTISAFILAAMMLFSFIALISCSNGGETKTEDTSSHFVPTGSDGISVGDDDLSNILNSINEASEPVKQ